MHDFTSGYVHNYLHTYIHLFFVSNKGIKVLKYFTKALTGLFYIHPLSNKAKGRPCCAISQQYHLSSEHTGSFPSAVTAWDGDFGNDG